jgi:hypothetical protein
VVLPPITTERYGDTIVYQRGGGGGKDFPTADWPLALIVPSELVEEYPGDHEEI